MTARARDGRWRRRAVTIPTLALTWLVLTVGSPLWLCVAALLDLVRVVRGRPRSWLRLYGFSIVYATYELVGLVRLLATWARHRNDATALRARTYRVQAWWAGSLLDAARRIFAIELRLHGVEHLRPGPVVVLFRHASLLDTLLPAALNARGASLDLRYVLKRELLVMPCLDVAGNILPNAFVARDGADSAAAIERVAALGEGLDASSGVLIYPEGTRFTPRKLARALERLRESAPARAQRLAALRHLCPIRPGGVVALLGAAPSADLVIVGHTGLDGIAELGDILRGGLVGCRVDVFVERRSRAEVPASDVLDWLDERWLELDARLGTAPVDGAAGVSAQR